MNRKHIARIIVLLIFVAFAILLYWKYGSYISAEMILSNRERLKNYTENYYFQSVLAFMGLYFVVVAFSIPGAVWLTLIGGFIFGAIPNLVFTNVSATAGATVIFLISRYSIGEVFQKKYSEKLKKFNNEIEINGDKYLLTVRLVPIFPFWMINIFSGITNIKTSKYIIFTSIGIIPGGFVYSYAGQEIGSITNVSSIMSPGIIFSLVLLGVLSLVPVVFNKLKKKE